MMYSRLKLARNLLSDDGVIFISIDDNELHNLTKICDEIFGTDNFIGVAGRITKKSNNKGEFWAPNFDYVLTFTKNIAYTRPFFGGANVEAYNLIETEGKRKGEKYQLVRLYMSTIKNRNPEQRYWIDCPDGSKVIPPGTTFPDERPNLGDGIWRWTKEKFDKERERIVIKKVRSSNLLNQDKEPAEWNVFTKTYLSDVIENASAKPNSFIEDCINQTGSHDIKAMGIPFDYSKPKTLIEYLMKVARIGNGDTILDFFAGSSTTAHAVMQLNAEDGGNRKFIMVQIPETTDPKSEAYKAGYPTIAEISKERIRRAGTKIRQDNADKDLSQLDTGFRVLKIDTTNMADIYYRPEDYSQDLLGSLENNIKEDRSDEDLLFQFMLDTGVPLSLPIERTQLPSKSGGHTIYQVGGNSLIASLDYIDANMVNDIAALNPLKFITSERAIATDSDKTNIKERFKQLSPHTDVRFI